VKRPWRDGIRRVPGSTRLMVLRWLLFLAAALPGLVVSMGAISKAIASRPYFAEAPDPLPLIPLIRLLGLVPGSVWGMLALTAAVAWLGQLLLTAGAVALFGTAGDARPMVWRTIFTAGSHSLWAYLRIALTALVAGVLGARIIALLSSMLLELGQDALWTMRTQFYLQFGRALLTVCWLLLVGVFAWWCRVIIVADERRRVRRLWAVVPRLWWRRPLGALGSHFLLALTSLIAGPAVLVSWRQSPSGGGGWAALWLVVLAGLSFLWHWRLRAGRLLWSSPDLLDLRTVPDAPWGLMKRLTRRARNRRRRPTTAADDSTEA
jgi:hypothetical protein